ncbi:RagB/SusD family nutrient uptake outer membrane protein [Spirosoma sp. KCTC 42546]|uniref:RagB/SusD family nutrient uptake outer membrane protein n=1 Tax=Spirosoma sp. KCTC 42546 TaxID=2520506 RepID=UPI0011596992|nr:RagB/SusD family nutrient uptake outer membrane protein [Spirosoma sp. KCTC 42546]QDK79010.1 RagB/SusD family nutrient uptake outer membrane protein [Spirosoma sp. KCTC 42546]
MKKIACLVIFASMFTVSCQKDFIELNPISTVSVEAVYKTDKDFQDAVVGVYSMLKNQYQDFWIFGDLRADDSWHALGNDAFLISVDKFNMNSDANLMISTWRNYYSAISRANLILSKIEGTDPAVVTNKDRHIAEAKFLRAFAYFDLVRIFGDVPLNTKPTTIEEGYTKVREKVDKIYDEVIIKDLLEAEAKLPAKYTGVDVGRATKGAAKAILGRVYMTRKDFVKAEAKFQEVTTLGYALLPNYKDLFDYTKDEHHSEYIFDIEYQDGNLGAGSGFSNKFLPKSANSLAETFYGIKGGAGEQNTPTLALFDSFDPTDPRRDVTVAKGYTDNNGVFQGFLQIATFTKKYLAITNSLNDSKVNWKVIRYADVLLMYAEALNENGKTDVALTYLNQVRTRAKMPTFSGLTKDQLRTKIYDERIYELSMEGVRWFDLARTDRLATVMGPLGFKPYNALFPIPLVEIQIINNPAVLPQNPGYN